MELYKDKVKACERLVETLEQESKGLQAQGSKAFAKTMLT
jgi:hypothetical protein